VEDDHLHTQDKISFKQIQEEPLIMPKEGWDNEIKQIFRENNIKPNVKFEVSDDQTIIAMVQNNLGISIRPEMTLSHLSNNVNHRVYEHWIGHFSLPFSTAISFYTVFLRSYMCI
jgi:DNA-binding transcriptional LysR family regulator